MNTNLSPASHEIKLGSMGSGMHFARNMVVSVCVFLLFWEWLRPLTAMAELTDIHRLNPFIWAIGTYLLLDALHIRIWVSWPLKVLFTAGWVGYWFRPDMLASGAWWLEMIPIVYGDYRHAVVGEWFAISPELRTFVFLLGWSALVYAVHRIITERGHGVWFVGATIGFLLLLQLWPGIDTNAGLLRSAAWGLFMLALLNHSKWEAAFGLIASGSRRSIAAGVTAGVMLGSAAIGGGYALSASLPKAVEPVRWDSIMAWAGEAGAAAGAQTGYSTFDGNLGGPIKVDDSVVFVARSSQPAYWRGESKDIYTGRGWRKSALSDTGEVFRSTPATGNTITQGVRIIDRSLSGIVFAGGPVLRLTELTSQDGTRLSDIHIRYDAETGSYYVGTEQVKLISYSLEASAANWDQDHLLLDNGTAPADLSRRNLQLPADLPQRVSDLAQQIVKDVPDNRLLRTLAVLQFLQDNYTYSLDTQLPPNGADFVDTFLFQQRAGYCNHFSTAMAVLLRSVGIESRWVKGFTPGTPRPGQPDSYEVRGSDAHSWVEVYFPETGWVPFEATPGFGAVASGSGRQAAGDDQPVRAVNMMLPESGTGYGANMADALRSAKDNEALGAFGGGAQKPAGEAKSGDNGPFKLWTGGFSPVWDYMTNGMRIVKQWYAAASAEDERLPKALLGLSAIGILAIAAPFLTRWAAKRSRTAGRRVSTRNAAAAVALSRLDAFWIRLYRRYGKRPADRTLREYVSSLPPQRRVLLEELLRYDESVRFGTDRGRRATREWLDDIWRKVSE